MMACYWPWNTDHFIVGHNGKIILYGNSSKFRSHVPLRDAWFLSNFDHPLSYDFCLAISSTLSDNREELEELIEQPGDKD